MSDLDKKMKEATAFFNGNNLPIHELIKRGRKQGLKEVQTRAGMVKVYERIMNGEQIKPIRMAWKAWNEGKSANLDEFMILEQDKESLRGIIEKLETDKLTLESVIDSLGLFKKWAIVVGSIGWMIAVFFILNLYVPMV